MNRKIIATRKPHTKTQPTQQPNPSGLYYEIMQVIKKHKPSVDYAQIVLHSIARDLSQQ